MASKRPNPYIGARPFEEKDRDWFFGRDEESRQLSSLVVAHQTVLFYAQSGAGKTSLLKAGLIPSLDKQWGMAVLPIARVGGELPRGVELHDIDNIYAFNALYCMVGEGAKAKELVGVDLLDGLRPYLEPQGGDDSPPSLLILDQFEELFTSYPQRYEERAGLFVQLHKCLDEYPQLGLLLSMREDFIAQLDFYTAMLPDRLRNRYRLERLTAEQARAAVEGPAARVGRPFEGPTESAGLPSEEPGAAQKLVDNLRRIQLGTLRAEIPSAEVPLGPYVEPLHLQIVCQRLWENLPSEGNTIRAEDVQTYGDVDEALKDFYQDCLGVVIEETGCDEWRLRNWFERKLITPANTRGLVFRDEQETAGVPNAAVDVLSRSEVNLIRRVRRGVDVWYELSHDRLVDPILQANQVWRQARQDLVPWLHQAEEWKEQGEPDALLLAGERLIQAERLRHERPEPLAPDEERFFQRSRERRLDAAPWLRQAEEWKKQGQPDALLLDGESLKRTERRLDGQPEPLAVHEEEFLQRSRNRRLDAAPWLRLADLWSNQDEPAELLLSAEILPGARIWAGQHPDLLALHEMRFLRRSTEAFQQAERQSAVERRTNLADLGWGVIFAREDDGHLPELRQVLAELLDWRRQGADSRYREFAGIDGYRPDETAEGFLIRHGAGPGTADRDRVPYYLLIVGDPETIPFEFQYALDVHHAVGRIHFDTLEDYRRYGRSVVAAEQGGLALPRRAAFVGVQNPDDRATTFSTQKMLKPLAVKIARDRPGWTVQVFLPSEAALAEIEPSGDATKAQLARLLGGDQTPALIFTTSHGMEHPSQDRRQLACQGALLCQDWPGPEAWKGQGEIPDDFYFSAADVPHDARLLGLVAFFWGSYTAGTPHLDDFALHRAGGERRVIAPRPFVTRLPQRLLAHPQGGALAVIGHVDRVWGPSFLAWDKGFQRAVFEETLQRLMDGHTVGSAMERFNRQYALLSSILVDELQRIASGRGTDRMALADQWTRTLDARNYLILGDPAVRLPVARESAQPSTRPALALGGGGLMRTVTRLTATRQRLEHRLEEILGAASLEVRTYVTADMELPPGDLDEAAELLVQTRVGLDGDTQVLLASPDGEVDSGLLDLQMEAVKVALSGRVAMVQAAASAANRLRGVPEAPEEPPPPSDLEGVTHRVV